MLQQSKGLEMPSGHLMLVRTSSIGACHLLEDREDADQFCKAWVAWASLRMPVIKLLAECS